MDLYNGVLTHLRRKVGLDGGVRCEACVKNILGKIKLAGTLSSVNDVIQRKLLN